MNKSKKIRQKFFEVLSKSFDTNQAKYLAQNVDRKFDLAREAGFGKSIPIPRQTAAQTILNYFKREEDIIKLFTRMLELDGTRDSGATIKIYNRDNFIKLLKSNMWIYDEDINRFYRDPFYENEINFLKSVRTIDLTHEVHYSEIINEIKKASSKLNIHDMEWQISVRLYELDNEKQKLLREIINLLLISQNLSIYTNDFFVCLKELAINASKANYKLLFEKHSTKKEGINSEKNYKKFLELFKEEIETHGNTRLSKFAYEDDMFFTITFQSKKDSISIWVSNYSTASNREKKRILKKLKQGDFTNLNFEDNDNYSEGAGFGISLILSILKKYSKDKEPLKAIFHDKLSK